jgi:hypothetical protein
MNSCCILPLEFSWGFYSGLRPTRMSRDMYGYLGGRSDSWILLENLGISSKDHSGFVGFERLEHAVYRDACNLTSLQSEVAIRWGKGELLL